MCMLRTHRSQVNGRKERVGIDMCDSKQSCHELQYPFAENNIINEKSHQIKYVPVSSIIFAGM